MMFHPGGPWDFQRRMSDARGPSGQVVINRKYIAFGNYIFGVYGAASGMSRTEVLAAAAIIYRLQTGHFGTGAYRGNPRNDELINEGYNDTLSGDIPP
jgi:hypothetical protein